MTSTARRLRHVASRARLVREPLRFALRELSGRPLVRFYRARRIGYRVAVRHNHPGPGLESHDTLPLWEIVARRGYEPPPRVAERLRERGEAARVVDLGGHLGYFAAFVLSEFPRASVVSFEPEPSHAELLRRCIEANGLERRWTLVEACAHTEDSRVRFLAGRSVASRAAWADEDPREAAVELPGRDVFPYIAGADLVKVDIEGGEWPILDDERFAEALPHALVLEYHSVPGLPGDNPKRAAGDRLRQLGYAVDFPADDGNPLDEPFWGRGLLWAYRPG